MLITNLVLLWVQGSNFLLAHIPDTKLGLDRTELCSLHVAEQALRHVSKHLSFNPARNDADCSAPPADLESVIIKLLDSLSRFEQARGVRGQLFEIYCKRCLWPHGGVVFVADWGAGIVPASAVGCLQTVLIQPDLSCVLIKNWLLGGCPKCLTLNHSGLFGVMKAVSDAFSPTTLFFSL